jgi:DNA-binding LacI/PurR family transcriptional regulator
MAAVVAEVTRAAQEQHVGTLITEMPDPAALNPALRRQAVDGALAFVTSELPADATDFLAQQMPVVRVMGATIAPLKVDHVGPDNDAVGYLGCQTLLGCGCRSLAYIAFHPTWDLGKLRGHGFTAAALDAGVRPHAFLVGKAEDDHLDCLYGTASTIAPDAQTLLQQLARAIRSRKDSSTPLGLFVSRDEEAVVVHQGLAALGIRISVDPIIVSCDNEQVRLAALHPRPISIDLDAPQIARNAVNRLLDRMKHPHDPPVRILVRPRIMDSTESNHVASLAHANGSTAV